MANARGLERGAVTVNECTQQLLRDQTKVMSLLPGGLTAVRGEFAKGDVILIETANGDIMGYGRAEYGAALAQELLGQKNQPELIHYNYLFLEG